MNIDFEKIRLDAIAECTNELPNSEFNDIAKAFIDVSSEVMKTMLIKYHETLKSTGE